MQTTLGVNQHWLTLLPLGKWLPFQRYFKCIFINWNLVFWLEFHQSLFLRVQLTISQPWFGLWLGAEQMTSHYLNQGWPSSPTHICDTRVRWVKILAGCREDHKLLVPSKMTPIILSKDFVCELCWYNVFGKIGKLFEHLKIKKHQWLYMKKFANIWNDRFLSCQMYRPTVV